MRFSSIFLPDNSPLIKAVVVIFLVFGLSSSSFAQRYHISPSSSDTMIDFAPSGHYSHFIFNIQNLTDGELLFHWQQVFTDIPAGWIVGMCDYGHCYGQLGMSGTMDPLPNTGNGIFALGVDPQNISGQAIVSYALWEEASPTEVDTITWVISSNNNTGLNNLPSGSGKSYLTLYPNPANDFITFQGSNNETFVEVYNTLGQLQLRFHPNNTNEPLDISTLTKGYYTLKIYYSTGEVEKLGRFLKF